MFSTKIFYILVKKSNNFKDLPNLLTYFALYKIF